MITYQYTQKDWTTSKKGSNVSGQSPMALADTQEAR